MSEIVIETRNLSKVFKRDEFQVTALDNAEALRLLQRPDAARFIVDRALELARR